MTTTGEAVNPRAFPPFIPELDIYLLGEGTHTRAYEWMGAHPRSIEGVQGVQFAVWAPNAQTVQVIGDFNGWDGCAHTMLRRNEGGIWELFVPGIEPGACYKYHIESQLNQYVVDKSDPYGFSAEVRPRTASIVCDLSGYTWNDGDWLDRRAGNTILHDPVLIYEVHLGSWRRHPDGSFLNYRELAQQLVAYVQEMGFTHIELMPITEHPFDVSWGYQTTGYYAPTSRFGSPQDFMYFVDYCHQHGIGVFLDWVPSHFAKEGHGLGFFDGAHIYEHADPRQGEHYQWGTYVFNYGRGEVLTFLLSNAHYWFDVYHVDGLRVDAVASMLYLDHLRPPGGWVPNKYGGRENLEAIAFLRRFNELAHGHFPGILTMAEESTSWPMVSRPTYLGGLGFTLKWNMGWMHDTLEYFKADPVYRRFIHNTITFSMIYNYAESFLLPLSHDEVVHLKSPLVYKAPGDEWQKFASLRLLLGYMWAHPGKKLLFMGGEFAQTSEWNYNVELPWWLLQYAPHQSAQRWMHDLNHLYRTHPALYVLDYDPAGFRWLDCHDVDQSVLIIMRRGQPLQPAAAGADKADVFDPQPTDTATRPFLIIACNFTPVVRHAYRMGMPVAGVYRECLNSDDRQYGGSGVINEGAFATQAMRIHGYEQGITITLPPLGVCVFVLS
jgi:1,4-alpha-glucan branching enzyme